MSHADPDTAERRLVTVVIPIYTLRLSATELLSLRQCFSVLGSHDIAIVKPEHLDISTLAELIGGEPRFRTESFPDEFFAGRVGYNRLMLSAAFYERFASSRYILIHQTDVYVFRDELQQWCQAGYDYIGAPWLPALADVSGWNLPRRAFYLYRRAAGWLLPGFHPIRLKYKVGNGGCSLRHTRHCLEATRLLAPAFERAIERSRQKEFFEDVFWSVTVNRLRPGTLRVAPYRKAARFSIESHPHMGMELTGGRLPMATHAFARPRNRGFWAQFIPLE